MSCRNWKLRLLISFQNSAIGLPCNVQSDLEDQSNELRNAEDQAKKAMADAARLADELRQEQDHAAQIEKMRRALENQVLIFCLPSLPCDFFFCLLWAVYCDAINGLPTSSDVVRLFAAEFSSTLVDAHSLAQKNRTIGHW